VHTALRLPNAWIVGIISHSVRTKRSGITICFHPQVEGWRDTYSIPKMFCSFRTQNDGQGPWTQQSRMKYGMDRLLWNRTKTTVLRIFNLIRL
jgi:hypothetical protein